MNDFPHIDEQGRSRMVDVSGKPTTVRTAVATSLVRMDPTTLTRLDELRARKGDVLETARLAGVMAAKRTAELIPLCHALPLESVEIRLDAAGAGLLRIEARTRTTAKTGVEMEAMTAAAVAALTVYDMCKGVDRGMTIESVRLEAKAGGASGEFLRAPQSLGEPTALATHPVDASRSVP